jgi:hypothetical protein
MSPLADKGRGSHSLWSATAQALVTRFHADVEYGADQRAVEAAILELVARHLEVELGTEAAFDALDVRAFCDASLAIDDGYRRRARSTLTRFDAFLAAAGFVSSVAQQRIVDDIEATLGEGSRSTVPRESFVRGLAEPAKRASGGGEPSA